MRLSDVNAAFLNFFNIEHKPAGNASISGLQSAFWNQREIRNDLSKAIVTNVPLRRKQYEYNTGNGGKKTILIDSQILFIQPEAGRKIYIIVEEINGAEAKTVSN